MIDNTCGCDECDKMVQQPKEFVEKRYIGADTQEFREREKRKVWTPLPEIKMVKCIACGFSYPTDHDAVKCQKEIDNWMDDDSLNQNEYDY